MHDAQSNPDKSRMSMHRLHSKSARNMVTMHRLSNCIDMQVMHIKVATMTWRQWHMNWYHAIGEAIFEIYSSACTYLDYCGGTKNSTELTPIFIEHPGDPWTWEDYIPPAAEAVKCLYPTQGWWIRDKPIQDKASMNWQYFSAYMLSAS